MTARDEVLDALRRARPELPDHVASPTSAAAQALLEEIVSMPVEIETETEVVPAAPAPPPDRFPRRRRALVAAGVVAAAAAAVATVALVGAPGDGGGGDTVQVVPATPSPAPGRSGHLEVTWERTRTGAPEQPATVTDYEFAGEDVHWAQEPSRHEYREVDGRAWSGAPSLDELADLLARSIEQHGGQVARPAGSADQAPRWAETVPEGPGPHDLDPAALLDELSAAGPFVPGADADVDGVATRAASATRPERVDLATLHLDPYFPESATSTLELWVDDDDVVRRLDVSHAGVEQGVTWTESWSLVWSDLGQAITVEPPSDEPIDVDEAAAAAAAEAHQEMTEAQQQLDTLQFQLGLAEADARDEAEEAVADAAAALAEAQDRVDAIARGDVDWEEQASAGDDATWSESAADPAAADADADDGASWTAVAVAEAERAVVTAEATWSEVAATEAEVGG